MATEQPDYPYHVLTTVSDVHVDTTDLEPGAVVIDSEHDVMHLRYHPRYRGYRWFPAGQHVGWRSVSVPAIVLVHGFGPDDYPEDWEAMGGEPL